MKSIKEVNWNQIKFTVVMPLYNCECYMRQAIDSVLLQKTDFSVLLVIADDASLDGSACVAADYERRFSDKILVLYSEKNQGLLANDIRIFTYMESEYFCVLDPDDYWVDLNFLQKAVDFLDSNNEYAAYGSNTKLLVNNRLAENFYIKTDVLEDTCNGIEDYLSGHAYVTHTTASVYRNVMFHGGVPDIMKEAVGTLAEASFRGDADRYVMHLKYGKAKFMNEWVGVYRIHEKGICQGATMFHWKLMNARAELDYSRFYDGKYYEKFLKRAMSIFKSACTEVYKAAIFEDYFSMSEYDRENFALLMNECAKRNENTEKRKRDINFKNEELKYRKFIKNKEKRSIIVWGTGKTADRLLKEYEITEEEIAAFADGDVSKANGEFHGKKIVDPGIIKQLENKYVVIASSYYDEIMEKIEREKLCEDGDIINLFWFDRYLSGL